MQVKSRNGKGMVLVSQAILKNVPTMEHFFAEDMMDKDPIVSVKLFTVHGWKWFLLAVDPDALLAFAYVVSPQDAIDAGEFGTIHLNELSKATFLSGFLGVERDLSFRPLRLSELVGR